MIPLSRITAIVLAAGLSRRHPEGDKLLRTVHNKPLAAHIADTLSDLPFLDRIVVQRQGESWLADIFPTQKFSQVNNPEPERGQGYSLALGVRQAYKTRNPEAVLICLADMPFITSGVIERLAAVISDGVGAVTCNVDGHISPPSIFHRCHSLLLMSLDGDYGARHMLSTLSDTSKVDVIASKLVDFDTREDFGD